MEESEFDTFILTTKLYNAALAGDLNSLQHLLKQDSLIIDRCAIEKSDRFMQSPLHVASSLGHLEFVIELLRLKPELAEQLDQSTRSSPLHLASAKGHLDIVQKLLEVSPNMCLARDQDGLNPVHVAAVCCQLHVLDLLVHTNTHATRERTNAGETVLHLCVKYAQLDALKYLVYVTDDSELLNAKDANDNTVLHLAVVAKQLEVVKFLVTNKKLQQSATNKNRLTAIEWLYQNGKSQIDKEIMRTLKRTESLGAKKAVEQKDKDEKWLKKQSNALMVVASLIATMAFQVGVNPPGGAFQDDSTRKKQDGQMAHSIGTSIMANRDPNTFNRFRISNTISLISSLSVVLLLISGIPCKRLFVVLLMITMCVATTTTTLTYYFSMDYLMNISNVPQTPPAPPAAYNPSAPRFVGYSRDAGDAGESRNLRKDPLLIVWIILVLIGFVLRVLLRPIKDLLQLVKKKLRKN